MVSVGISLIAVRHTVLDSEVVVVVNTPDGLLVVLYSLVVHVPHIAITVVERSTRLADDILGSSLSHLIEVSIALNGIWSEPRSSIEGSTCLQSLSSIERSTSLQSAIRLLVYEVSLLEMPHRLVDVGQDVLIDLSLGNT